MYPGWSILVFVILAPLLVPAQIDDNFSDGDFTNDPVWSGAGDLFIVVEDEDDLKLRSNSASAATYWLSTPNALASNCFWEVEVDLRLNTSGSNYVEVHLIADQPDPIASQNGWFVRIGGTQDRIELFKEVAGSVASVISSSDGVVNSTTSNKLKIRVERSEDLDWTLFYDDDLTGIYTALGPVNDPEISITSHFAILVEQNSTASMVNNHYFDDVLVDVLPIDLYPPAIQNAEIIDGNIIALAFTEAVGAGAADPSNYSVSEGIGSPETATMQAGNGVHLSFGTELLPGIMYSLSIAGVQDLAGNQLDTVISLMIAEQAVAGDLVINELLYDPIGEGADFLELFNRSQKAIQFAGMKIENGSGSISPLTTDHILMPGGHIFISTDTASIFMQYPHALRANAIQNALPTFVNSSGSVIIKNQNDEVVDRFDYDDDLHFDLMDLTEGFSLERVDPDRQTSDPTNWQTASDLAGRATPGFQNSQFSPAPEPIGSLTIEPSIFSPDNDGYQDLLTITYSFESDGFVGTLLVFDVAGREVRSVFASKILGTFGSVSWDGLADDGSKCRIGAYIVLLEAFDLEGNVQRFKKTVTLAHHLDR